MNDVIGSDHDNATTAAAAKWYDISEAYADMVLKRTVGADYDRNVATIQEVLAKYAHAGNELEYAFSTRVRGRETVALLRSLGIVCDKPQGQRYLDIGCAYGGFLAAFAEIGYDVSGIEISGQLIPYARTEIRAESEKILLGDFLDPAHFPDPEQFDLVTCNDVIEHVADPRACLAKLYRLLKPGGTAYIETANKRSIINVYSDIHCQLFGLSLLDHHEAKAAYQQYSGWHEYQVSEFYVIEWYMNNANALGAETKIIKRNATSFDVAHHLETLFSRYNHWKQNDSAKLDIFLRHEVEAEFFRYCSQMLAERASFHNVADEAGFIHKWVDAIVRFTLTKPKPEPIQSL